MFHYFISEATTTTTVATFLKQKTAFFLSALYRNVSNIGQNLEHHDDDNNNNDFTTMEALHHLATNMSDLTKKALSKLFDFISPDWSDDRRLPSLPLSLQQLWHETAYNSTFSDFMLRHFDTNGDGHISPSELLNMTEVMARMQHERDTFWSLVSREWPLLEWKLGVLVWRTFGGALMVLAVVSIIPGRLHAYAAKLLRWPLLGLVYFLIAVELVVYVVIRIGIRVAESLVARPKHQQLRRHMAAAKSYREWYAYAAALDKSQKRDRWLRQCNDHTSYRYNWAFIRELIMDLQLARRSGDSLLALAVVQQCTRQNVGGVMSADLFSYSNTGQPKAIVTEFINEVVHTLQWLTDDALQVPNDDHSVSDRDKCQYEAEMQQQVRSEKDRLWKARFSILDHNDSNAGSAHGGGGGSSSNHTNGGLGDQRTVWAPDNNGTNERNKVGSTSYHDDDHDSVVSGNDYYDEREQHHRRGMSSARSDSDQKRRPHHHHHPGRAAPFLPSCHREEVLAFLRRARHAYGRTALCLSGGAMLGMYHFGHIRGLLETGNLPRIISGTSAGAVIGSIIGTRTDAELDRDLRPEILQHRMKCFDRPWSERLRSIWQHGNLFDFDTWMNMIQWFTCGNLTFEEAYKKTGRVFCITLSSTTKKAPPVLLNHLSAPNVTIASAVIASAAVPGFVAPVRLQYKDANGRVRVQGGSRDQTYFDGSIRHDIPVAGLAEMLNCQFFVACQCNPHVVPFFFNTKGSVGRPSRWSSGTQEDSWRGGFLLAALEMYLKNDMKAKFVFLNDVEAAVGFTSTMMTQDFVGTVTIVPQTKFIDYFRLFRDPLPEEVPHYFQTGAVAAYEHTAMIKLHYKISDALDDCVARLEKATRGRTSVKYRSVMAVADQKIGISEFKAVASGGGAPTDAVVSAFRARKDTDGGVFSAGTASSSGDDDDSDNAYSSNNWIDLQ